MATKKSCVAEDWKLACEDSIELLYLLPLSGKASILQNPPDTWDPQESQNPEAERSRSLNSMVRRRRGRGRGGRTRASSDRVAIPSPEGSEETPSNAAIGPNPPESVDSRQTNPTHGTHTGESSSSPVALQPSPQYPIVFFSLDSQPPEEIRTNDPLPPIVVGLRIGRIQRSDGITVDDNSLWGQASLVSADGRIATAQFRADILSGGSLVAPLLRTFSSVGEHNTWSLTFKDLVIREPGYFKIRIALIGTSQDDSQSQGNPVIDAPTEQLSISTSLIRAHAFAPVWRNRAGPLET